MITVEEMEKNIYHLSHPVHRSMGLTGFPWSMPSRMGMDSCRSTPLTIQIGCMHHQISFPLEPKCLSSPVHLNWAAMMQNSAQ